MNCLNSKNRVGVSIFRIYPIKLIELCNRVVMILTTLQLVNYNCFTCK